MPFPDNSVGGHRQGETVPAWITSKTGSVPFAAYIHPIMRNFCQRNHNGGFAVSSSDYPHQGLFIFYWSTGNVIISLRSTIPVLLPLCHHLDLDLRPFWQPGDLHHSPGWIRVLKISQVDLVDRIKILQVCQVDPCLDNAGKIKPGLL